MPDTFPPKEEGRDSLYTQGYISNDNYLALRKGKGTNIQ